LPLKSKQMLFADLALRQKSKLKMSYEGPDCRLRLLLLAWLPKLLSGDPASPLKWKLNVSLLKTTPEECDSMPSWLPLASPAKWTFEILCAACVSSRLSIQSCDAIDWNIYPVNGQTSPTLTVG